MLLLSTTFKIENDPIYMTGKYYGKAEGKVEEKKEIALEMKKHGIDLTFIANITRLPLEEIQTL